MKRLIIANIIFIAVIATLVNGCVVPATTPTTTPSTSPGSTSESDQPSNPASSLPSLPTNNPKETKTSTPLYGKYTIVHADVTGPEEIVFDWTTDRCEMEDIPDLPARAFRDADGKVQLIATHYIGRRMIGDTINSVQRDCTVVLNSDKDADPSKYNDCEWLGSPYTFDGNMIYALIHNEYQGHTHPGMSISGEYFKNWYNSITFAKSNDKGKNYTHDIAPSHFVASLPYQYVPEEGPSGISIASNIVHNPKDGYFYAFIHVFEAKRSTSYTSLMRTRTIDDPRSWRAWNGKDFALEFIDPYVQTPDKPLNCIPQPILLIGGSSLTFNTYLNKYVAVGTGYKVYDKLDNKWHTGFYFSFSEDLIHWTPPQLILEAPLNNWPTERNDEWLAYPSLIDQDDTSRNFEITGQEPYLYYTRKHATTPEDQALDRDLVRIPIRFTQETLETGWEFNNSGNDEGWYPVNDLTPFIIDEGVLKTSSTSREPYMHLDPVLNFDASIYNTIEMRMKVSDGYSGQFFFTTTEDEIWDEQKSVHFKLRPTSDFETYTVNMASVNTWSGEISQIRLDPADAEADIEIDYIRIYTIQ